MLCEMVDHLKVRRVELDFVRRRGLRRGSAYSAKDLRLDGLPASFLLVRTSNSEGRRYKASADRCRKSCLLSYQKRAHPLFALLR
eukprot:UN00633